ncbi:unnamed protein product [Durusdinium trenchii]|uniref:Methyltransferase domain-containing protein n=1 Tax=Durusdinium trenchii TaxID=1381693 RepID=A0ABP0RJ59_9DINO
MHYRLGYKEQWGKEGRNDLDVIKKLGGNAIRLYHSFGYGPRTDHGSFLDAAHSNGLSVLPGVDSDLAIHNCTDFDCYETVKEVIKTGFSVGFAKGKEWHPAIHTVILFNEPDFFGNDPKCPKKASWCRVKAAISALDGLLAAEKEANISAGRVNLTTTWSFAALDSIDGKCKNCPGYFGFQDMLAVIENASIAKYIPRTPVKEIADAFNKRWVNALNVQAPWTFVKETITKNYGPFGNRPWFIGEFGDLGQTQDVLKNDIQAMHEFANSSSLFLGTTVFQPLRCKPHENQFDRRSETVRSSIGEFFLAAICCCHVIGPMICLMRESQTNGLHAQMLDSNTSNPQGIIRDEIDAAAKRAQAGQNWQNGVCTPGHGECAAKGRHEEVPEGFIPGDNLLAIDAGCGPGLWLRGLSRRFSHVIALDQSQNLLEKADHGKEANEGGDQSRLVEIRPAVDLGQPCSKTETDGKVFCGPEVPGTREKADLVASFNVLISPNKEARENILRREAEMLRPALWRQVPSSTLLLLVPSAESFRAVRALYQQQGGAESGLGQYVDYLSEHPEEEAHNVFRVYARTKHYTEKEACDMVERVGLSCAKVISHPMRWRYVFPLASDEAFAWTFDVYSIHTFDGGLWLECDCFS